MPHGRTRPTRSGRRRDSKLPKHVGHNPSAEDLIHSERWGASQNPFKNREMSDWESWPSHTMGETRSSSARVNSTKRSIFGATSGLPYADGRRGEQAGNILSKDEPAVMGTKLVGHSLATVGSVGAQIIELIEK